MGACKYYLLIVFVVLLCATPVVASDLDDGISKFTDDNISKWDDLGKKDRNVTFIKADAISRADVRSKRGKGVKAGSGDNNMNSVVMGAGSNVRGDIIIIDESRGDKTQVGGH